MARQGLLNELIRLLEARGYKLVEPADPPRYGGVWTHPDWDGTSDKLFPALEDALDREVEEAQPRGEHERRSPASKPAPLPTPLKQ